MVLSHTFVHIPGVGQTTERRLWQSGLLDWECALRAPAGSLPARCRRVLPEALAESCRALACGDARFFAQRVPASQVWRLYSSFRGRAAFFDIETTGMDAWSYVTSVALYDGRQVRTYVRDRNLHEFPRDIREYALLVSYNGKCFDVPVLEREFPGLRLDQAHIDLRYVLATLGYAGGLKGCEQRMGLPRDPALRDVDGFTAVRLWWAHERGDRRALPALLRYNIEDAVNLQWLMETAYNLCVSQLPIQVAPLEVAARPPIDCPYDPSILDEMLGRV